MTLWTAYTGPTLQFCTRCWTLTKQLSYHALKKSEGLQNYSPSFILFFALIYCFRNLYF